MTFLTNLTLGKKITLLTAIGLLLGVGVFSSLGLRAVNQATETMLQDRLTTAQMVADYVDEALGRALTELETTAILLSSAGTEEDIEREIELLETTYYRLSVYTSGIYLLNDKGQVTWSKPDISSTGGFDLTVYPSVEETVRTEQTAISGLVSAPVAEIPAVLLSSPVREGSIVGKGTLVAAVDLTRSSIGGFIQPIRVGQTGYVEIVDQNGIVVVRTEPGPELAPFEKSDHSGRFAALISAGQPTRGVCHTCHEPEQRVERRDVLAFVPIQTARWGVVLRQSELEALAPAQQLRQNLLLFGAGLVAVALLFVIVTTRNVGSRIGSLTTASQKIADGDLLSPILSLGKDEVGILAQALDEMRAKLQTSYGDLEQKTKELSSLLSVSEILTSPLELPQLLNAVVAKAMEVIHGADASALLLQDADQRTVRLQCAIGLPREIMSQFSFTAEDKAAPDDTAQKDVMKEAIEVLFSSETLYNRVKSYIQAQVLHKNRHIGSLVMLSFTDGKAFSPSDSGLLQAIADDIAIAIERAQLTKEAEEVRALQEVDRLRSQFISSVSHELRTPLTLIKGYSTSLLREDVSWDRDSYRDFLQIIDEKTDELRDLIDKLLQSAKLEAGALKLEKEPLIMPRLAQKIAEETSTRTRNHPVRLNFAPSFPVVEADVRCIEQVLRNLVENAVKYSPEGGQINITGEVEGDSVIVSVSDRGVGIPAEHQQHIFERFYRVDSPLTRRTGGSGLGLFITKGHIEAHGGKIWLESATGNGSKFYFSLPLEHGEDGKPGQEN